MPGTAADAIMALHITQSGLVRWFSSLVGECVLKGMTLTLSTLPVSSYASRKVSEPRVKKEACMGSLAMRLCSAGCLLTFLAQETVSNLAPVFLKRENQTRKGSSQAVILSARRGTSKRRNSASVLVQTRAAINPPAEVPAITRGNNLASRKALTTPKW